MKRRPPTGDRVIFLLDHAVVLRLDDAAAALGTAGAVRLTRSDVLRLAVTEWLARQATVPDSERAEAQR